MLVKSRLVVFSAVNVEEKYDNHFLKWPRWSF